jgi:hypothetical protein
VKCPSRGAPDLNVIQMRLLILSALFCIPATTQTFQRIDYLHRADDNAKSKPVFVLGTMAFDAANRSMTFKSLPRTKYQIKHGFPEVNLGITNETISSALYERSAVPRYGWGIVVAWPLLFTKEKKHFLTVQYKEKDEGRYAVFQLDKNNFREVLAAMEAALGKTVERSEEH